jgi:type I restriction enzyme S subunit
MSIFLRKYLPLLSTASDGIQKLRGLIFELALRGKLVPQNPDDEPASELLKRIAQERVQLVAEGKIRKTKPIPVVKADEQAFELPSTWAWVRFGSIADCRLGKMLDAAKNQGKLKPYLRNTNVQWWRFDLGDIKEMRLTDDELHEFRLSKGDLLICEGGEPGRCAIWRSEIEEMYFQKALHRARPFGGCSSEYLQIALRQDAGSGVLNSYFTGATIKHFPGDKLNSYVLPLPPIAEQHRIVAKVGELMVLCDRLETEQADAACAHIRLVDALLGTLTQSSGAADFAANWQRLAGHFDTLFTTETSVDALKQTIVQLAVMGKLVPQNLDDEPASELLKRMAQERSRLETEGILKKSKSIPVVKEDEQPFATPKGWQWRHLDELVAISGGVTLGRNLVRRKVVSRPYLRVANVQRGHLLLDRIKTIEVPIDEQDKYRLEAEDLLITEGGDWDKVGRTAIWRNEIEDCLHQNHVFKARRFSSEWDCRWAEMYLNSTPARTYFAASSKQTTNLASINMTQLKACPFPVPPLAEQRRIVAKVDELITLCDALRADLVESRDRQSRLASTLVGSVIEAA